MLLCFSQHSELLYLSSVQALEDYKAEPSPDTRLLCKVFSLLCVDQSSDQRVDCILIATFVAELNQLKVNLLFILNCTECTRRARK